MLHLTLLAIMPQLRSLWAEPWYNNITIDIILCPYESYWDNIIDLAVSHSIGTLQHVYTELPFTVAICAISYHPSEHMLAISGFGSHQPLVVCTHISRKTKSEDLEVQNTQITDRTDSSNGRIDIMGQDSMILHLNQRIREVTKTLNQSTISDSGTGRTKVRKKINTWPVFVCTFIFIWMRLWISHNDYTTMYTSHKLCFRDCGEHEKIFNGVVVPVVWGWHCMHAEAYAWCLFNIRWLWQSQYRLLCSFFVCSNQHQDTWNRPAYILIWWSPAVSLQPLQLPSLFP